MSINEPDAARPATSGPRDLARVAPVSRRERSQLLRHIIAKDDEIDSYREAQKALRRERDDLATALSRRDNELQSLRATRPTGSRPRRALVYGVVITAAAVLSVTLFDRAVYRPMQATLQTSVADLDARVKQAAADNRRLETELAAAQRSVAAATSREAAPVPSSGDVSSSTEDLASKRSMADRIAALDVESKRLAQVKRDLDLGNEKLAADRTALDKERAAVQADRKAAFALAQPPTGGVMVWRGTTTVQTAVMVTMNKANFGSVRGSLPGRDASVDIIVRQGTITVLERPDDKNKWSRFYFQVQGPGSAVVYVIWTIAG